MLAAVSGGPITLAIGATDNSSITASYIVTAADFLAGGIENTAKAFGTATDADGTVIANPNNPGSPFIVEDGLFGGEDDEVTFNFLIRNTGNVDLTNVTITDEMVTMTGGPIDLMVGQVSSIAFSATYVVLAEDLTRGYFENTATASGDAEDSRGGPIFGLDGNPISITDVSDAGTTGQKVEMSDPPNEETPTGTGVTDDDPGNDPTVQSLPSNPDPSIQLVKSVTDVADTNGSGRIDAGDTVTYGFSVINTGNVRLANVTIVDVRAPVAGGPITLELGQTDTSSFSATAVITAQEAAAAAIENTATATAGGVNSAGDPFLDPEMGKQLSATDISDAGTEPEIGETGTPTEIDDPEATRGGGDDPTVLSLPNPSIDLRKRVTLVEDTNGDGLFGSTGDIIRYAFSVTNTGNTTLSDVTVEDVNATISGGPISLDVGAVNSTAFTGTHLIIGAEFAAGFVENTATTTATPVTQSGEVVRGSDGSSVVVEDVSDTGTDAEGEIIDDPSLVESPTGTGGTDDNTTNDPTVLRVPTNPKPLIQLVKSVDSVADTDEDAVQGGVDDIITFGFAVTNVGNTDLVNVVVSDAMLGGEIGALEALAIRALG